jgi:uncharacterized membrane protein YciS (DUF1049 family)
MKHLRFIIAIVLMVIVLTILVQNHTAMSTRVVFRANLLLAQYESPDISLYIIVTITFLFGILVSGLYGILERFRLQKQIRLLQKQVREKDAELNSLRNLPITAEDVIPEKSTEETVDSPMT